MDKIQTLQLRQSELKVKVQEMLDTPAETRGENFTDELGQLTKQVKDVEVELQAALVTAPDPEETRIENADLATPEEREIRELRSQVHFGRYISAAITGGGVRDGAELAFNQALGLESTQFPMDLLALETRAARDGDARGNQGTWLDRVMYGTAADRLGVTMTAVAPGVAAYPVMTAAGSAVQRGRTEAVTESTFSVAVTELKPSRAAVNGKYSIEDNYRLPGLADAILRDMRAGMSVDIDAKIFKGDSGANEAGADIVGLQGATVGETTITQANKVKAKETLQAFLGHVDGQYAMSFGDLRVVAAEGANTLWESEFPVTNSAETLAAILRRAGLSWVVRGDIETATNNGDFGAFIGLARGIQGAAKACVWSAGELVRDPYTSAKKGEVELTLNYLWNLAIPRAANFKRVKFVT